MNTQLPKIIYFGNLPSVAASLADMPLWSLTACIVEDEEDMSLMKIRLGSRGIPVHQVNSNTEIQKVVLAMEPLDLGVVANFGIILTRGTLRLARLGFVNAHLGLLPENPGRHPIQKSLERGDATSGVTLHHVTPKVDRGPTIDLVWIPIGNETTGRELMDRMAEWIPALIERNGSLLLGADDSYKSKASPAETVLPEYS